LHKYEIEERRRKVATLLAQSNLSPIGLEIAFVVIAIVGFGILTFEFAGRVDNPPYFYPK